MTPGWIVVAVTLAGVIFQAGIHFATVLFMGKRLEKVENSDTKQWERIDSHGNRIVRLEERSRIHIGDPEEARGAHA